ncbi:MAG: SMI1/KNR4 family protein [Proteobacteria bacterium]|nr:SMI1/KNR4 family protein [Pseudomonadota bacterium]
MTITPTTARRFTDTFAVPDKALETPNPGGWEKVEQELSLVLPEDYKWFIEQYGTGCVSMYVWILNPFSKNENLNLIYQIGSQSALFREMKDELGEEGCPYRVYPDEGGLVPFAISDNGDTLFWLADSQDPQDWPVVVNQTRSSIYEVHEQNMTSFLLKLVTGEIKSEIFLSEYIEPDRLFLPFNEVEY